MESSSTNWDDGISRGMVIEQRPVTSMPMVIQQRPVFEQRPSVFGSDNNVFSNNMFSNFQHHFQSPFQSIFSSSSSQPSLLSNIFSFNGENEDQSPSEIARQNAVSLDFKPWLLENKSIIPAWFKINRKYPFQCSEACSEFIKPIVASFTNMEQYGIVSRKLKVICQTPISKISNFGRTSWGRFCLAMTDIFYPHFCLFE